MNPDIAPRWIAWAREIQALSQTGLAFSTAPYDIQRYTRMMEIAAEITESQTGISAEALRDTFMRQPGYATPKIDVRGAVVRDDRILLVQERIDQRWCLPGGWADVGDIPSAMVAREIREESGIEATAKKVVGVYDANRTGRPLEFYHAFKIIFLCEITGGSLRGSDETLAAGFFSFDDLPPLSSPRTDSRHLIEIQAHLRDERRPTAFD
jgi:ADP-ribose pyrophosphatase YjhB (NUDIX family)